MSDNKESELDKITKNSISSFFDDESYHNESDIDIKLTQHKNKEEITDYTEIVSNLYKEILNREPDLGGLKLYSNQLKYKIITEDKLRSTLRESKEYKDKFGISDDLSDKPGTTTQEFQSPENLIYCMMGTNRLDEIKPYIASVLPYIDKFVFVDGGSNDGTLEYINELSSRNDKIVLLQKPWRDKFSEQRNNYIEYLRSLNYNSWVIVSDSVLGERCTTIINEKGFIEVIPFEELFDRYSKIITPVTDENGKDVILNPLIRVLASTKPKIFEVSKIQDLRNYPDDMNYLLSDTQLKILTLYKEGNGYKNIGQKLNIPWDNARTILRTLRNKKEFVSINPEWCSIKKIIRHKINKQLTQINTKHGGTCVTKDHSLIKIENGKYEKINPDDFINNNKTFISIDYIKNEKILDKIDLSEYINIENSNKIKIKNKNIEHITNQPITNDYIYFHQSYGGVIPRIKRYYENTDLEKLCEILGAFISEGSTVNPTTDDRTNGKWTGNLFSISNSNKEWLEKIRNNLEHITIDCTFKYNIDNKDTPIYHLRTYQKLLVELFERLCGNDASTKKIPSFIYNLDYKYKKIFLDNLIKGDGWKNKEYWLDQGKNQKYAENHFQYTTTSLKLASGVSTLLKTMNINHSIHRETNARGIKFYNILHKLSYKEKKDIHQVIEEKNIDFKEIYVYDLEVENSNIFIDSLGSVLLHNTDEHFPEETLKQLKSLISASKNGTEYTGIKFQVEDILVDDDDRNKILSRKVNEYWKCLMFKFSPEIHYEGEPHESLIGMDLRWIDTKYIYQHIRSSLHILSRASENFFISNSNRYSDKWAEFRYLCTKNNILVFKDYWELFEKHELPKEVENWIVHHKDDKEDSGDSEVRETYMLYEEVLPKRKQKKQSPDKLPGERLSHSLDNKVTNEVIGNIPENKLTIETSTSNYNISSGTGTYPYTLPDIKVNTTSSTSIKQSEYELINHRCEQCESSNESLIEMVIRHKHGITMCKKCWLELADKIKKTAGKS